jgi:hypothetical protein
MRGSRIPHPVGGRLVKVWRWAVDAVGKDAATLLGELEWRDRTHDQAKQPLATRAELIASLDGFMSVKKLDKSIEILADNGWIVVLKRQTLGERNIRHWHEYSLDAQKIADFLGENTDVAKTERREFQNGNSGDSNFASETGTRIQSKQWTVSLSSSQEKEKKDEEFARRAAQSAGLTTEETDAILAQCRFASEMPAAVKNFVVTRDAKSAEAALEKNRAAPPPGFDPTISQQGARLYEIRHGGASQKVPV